MAVAVKVNELLISHQLDIDSLHSIAHAKQLLMSTKVLKLLLLIFRVHIFFYAQGAKLVLHFFSTQKSKIKFLKIIFIFYLRDSLMYMFGEITNIVTKIQPTNS